MKRAKQKSELGQYLYSILTVVGLFLVIRTSVVQAFYIPSSSMEDTLLVGDYLLANKFVYGVPVDVPLTSISLFRLPALREPEQGDIVIFRSPQDEGRDLIKRCVAVGGQRVEIVNKVLYVDGEPVQDPPLAKHTDRAYYPREFNPRDNFGPVYRARRAFLYDGRQPRQQLGQPLFSRRAQAVDQGQGHDYLLVVGARHPRALLQGPDFAARSGG